METRFFKSFLHLLALALTHLRSQQKHQATTELLPHGFQDKSSRIRSQYIQSNEIEVLQSTNRFYKKIVFKTMRLQWS